ncbi:MAG: amidohydrolase family protein [Spirochaetes bacterium]|nr:amidohydrolase family protein [Spirochaetota bacterium]
MSNKQIIIEATTLYDGQTKKDNQYIIVEEDRIVDVSSSKMKADFSGIVTPAIIDAHSHIGMWRQGEPDHEGEGNDRRSQFCPLNDPLNSIYFDDRAFSEAVDFGVLYSCVVPGSGNLLGGQAKVIRNFANNRDEALVKDYGFKMALGYNPRSTTSWKGERSNTRMGIYAMLEQKFDDVLQKQLKATHAKEKKLFELQSKAKDKQLNGEDIKQEEQFILDEYELEFSSEEKAILQLLNGKKIAKVHVHKEDDVQYLIQLVKKYHIRVTAEHVCDVHHTEIFNQLAEAEIPVVYGPLGSLDYKVELKHAYYQNTKLLMESNALYGYMTDHPVILTPYLRDNLKYFLIQGMSDADAISIITHKNAKILGIDDRLGTVEKGKTASLVVWNNHPLSLTAFPKAVIAEGKIVRAIK